MTLRTQNWEERMGKEEQMGLDSPGQWFTSSIQSPH